MNRLLRNPAEAWQEEVKREKTHAFVGKRGALKNGG